MMPPCARCGSTRLKRKGQRACPVPCIRDGRPATRHLPVQRTQCLDCGASGHDEATLAEARAGFLDEVGGLAVRTGVGRAARGLGLTERKVASALAAWIGRRAGDVPDRLPACLVVAVPTILGQERIALADADTDAVLDLLPSTGPERLAAWMAARAGEPAAVVGPLDARTRDAVAAAAPNARYGVPPGESRRIMERWADAVMRLPGAVARHGAAVKAARLVGPPALLACLSDLAEALGEPTVRAQAASWRDAVAFGASAHGSTLHARLQAAKATGRAWEGASFARLRARVLLDDGPRVMDRMPGTGAAYSLGVPVVHAERILRENAAGPRVPVEAEACLG